MRRLSWIGIIALSSAIFGGCASGENADTTGTGAAGGDEGGGGSVAGPGGGGGAGAGTGAAGGAGGAGGQGGQGGLTYSGTILDGFDQTPIPDVEVCALEPTLPCVTSNASGAFSYGGVPENTRVRVGASKNLYFPVETLIDTTDVDGTLTAFMLSRGIITIGLNAVGVTFDDQKPAISVTVRNLANQPLAGYVISTTPTSGEGPFYIDGTSISTTATETTQSGTAFIVNMDPGTYDVNVSGPAACTASFINDDPNTHAAPLINAAQFVVIFDCP